MSKATILAPSPPAPSSTSIDLAMWKWVIFIGLAAVVVFYIVKRISEIVVTRRTESIIRDVVGKNTGEDNEN